MMPLGETFRTVVRFPDVKVPRRITRTDQGLGTPAEVAAPPSPE